MLPFKNTQEMIGRSQTQVLFVLETDQYARENDLSYQYHEGSHWISLYDEHNILAAVAKLVKGETVITPTVHQSWMAAVH